MKRTEFYPFHKAAGAKLIEFAGFEMPVSYAGVKVEHEAVRTNAGLFDVSHMGQFLVTGEEALQLIQYVTSNDASKLKPGRAQYSCLPNEMGGIVDDLLVYQLKENEYLLVVNAANIDKDFEWIVDHNHFEANIENVSDEWSLLALQGPNAEQELQKITEIELSKIKYYRFKQGTVADIENVIISATGYTGERGFELYFKVGDAEKMWQALTALNIELTGLASRDTLRLEMGYALYGNDIDDFTSPMEAGLAWITKLDKEDFIAKERFVQQAEKGTLKKLCGFKMKYRGIPRKDYPIVNAENERIGIVTSGTQSPSLAEGIGMGYLQSQYANEGDEIFIEIRNKTVKAILTSLPFYTTK